MSFGVVQNAITTIKTNRGLLSKRDRLKHILSGSRDIKTDYNLPKVTAKELLAIRKRMQLEHRRRRVKQIVLLSVIMLTIICVLLYFA